MHVVSNYRYTLKRKMFICSRCRKLLADFHDNEWLYVFVVDSFLATLFKNQKNYLTG